MVKSALCLHWLCDVLPIPEISARTGCRLSLSAWTMFSVMIMPSEPWSIRAQTKADCPVELFTIRTSAVARRIVEFRWEATALKSCVDVAIYAASALRTESEACCWDTPGVNEELYWTFGKCNKVWCRWPHCEQFWLQLHWLREWEELRQLMHAFERSSITFRANQSLARKSGYRLRQREHLMDPDSKVLWKLCPLTVEFPDGLVSYSQLGWCWPIDCQETPPALWRWRIPRCCQGILPGLCCADRQLSK